MLELSTYAFNFRNIEELKEQLLYTWKHTENWGTFRGNDLSSQVVVFPMCVNLFSKKIKMAGIGNVATYPEYRRQGDVRRLFTRMSQELYENGTVLSYLAPFNRQFYRNFGYESIFNNIEIEIDRKDILKLDSEKPRDVRRVLNDENQYYDKIKQLYKVTLQERNGSVIREDWWWQIVFKQTGRLWAVCLDGLENITGYLSYEMGEKNFIIHELAYSDRLTLDQLVSFISSHSATFEKFKFIDKSTEVIRLLLEDVRDVRFNLNEGMMVKIVSFEKFIANYEFNQTKEAIKFKIAVKDEFSSWNHGIWELFVADGKGKAVRISEKIDSEAELTGTIQSWTQVFFGKVRLSEQVLLNVIQTNTKEEINFLEKLMKVSDFALFDSF